MRDRPSALSVGGMQNTAIEVHDLCKAYGGQPVLRCVSFAVGGTRISGIAAPNGAVRTTTVEILQGLRNRDGGHVAVLGLDPARERERRRPLLGAQLQTSPLPDRLRVGKAVRLADRQRSMFPRAAALYGMRHAQATLGWVADVRLTLRTRWVALSEFGYRAAGGW
jgi:ABC-type multidrug transport system ATPase subunit